MSSTQLPPALRVSVCRVGHEVSFRPLVTPASTSTHRRKGRTYDQLYNEARHLGIAGRSKMDKESLERAVDWKEELTPAGGFGPA